MRLNHRYGVVQSVFGANNVFKGQFKLDSPLRVDGFVSGQFISTSRLHISVTGKGEGVIYAHFIEIGGQFIGDLHAVDRVIIRASAFVKGNICARSLQIEEGALYVGYCSIGGQTNELQAIIQEKGLNTQTDRL